MTVVTLSLARNRVEHARDLLALLDSPRMCRPYAPHETDCTGYSNGSRTCNCGADELNNRLRVALEQLRGAL